MKLAFASIFVTLAGAAAAALPARIVELPAYEEPAYRWTDVTGPSREVACRSKIEQARADAGKPRMERGASAVNEPMIVHAVDHRIDGCEVLVPVADRADIRPVPAPGREEILPAR